MNLKTIKTDEFTIKSGHLDVGNGHKVWFEQWGNPEAKVPILFFHGGPGGEFKPKHKYNFDSKQHQVIGFDQRGGGNSLPYGEIKHNTTQDIINDAKNILSHLGVKRVHISGGSWGSALALLFAIEHPELVETVMVSGVFSARQKEINWIDKGVFKTHYPEVWERFANSVPSEYKENPTEYHYKIIREEDTSNIVSTSRALSNLEVPIMMFDWRGYEPEIKKDTDPTVEVEAFDPVPYKIYGHYLDNSCFLKPRYILNNVHKITAPLYIVQGRYDMCCPPITAYQLHQSVPHSKLYMTLASHGNDSETNTALKTLRDLLY